MLIGRPLFYSSSSKQHLEVVFKKLGTPHEGLVKILNPNFNEKLPKLEPQSWKKVSHKVLISVDFTRNRTLGY